MIAPLVLLVLIGAVGWFAWLVWKADIATELRNAIWKKWGSYSFIGRLIKCPYCIAPYGALPATTLTFALDASWSVATVWHAVLTWAAVSFAGGWLAYQVGK